MNAQEVRDMAAREIRAARKKAGLTLRQVAEETAATAPQVSQWEHGKVLPRWERLEEVLKVCRAVASPALAQAYTEVEEPQIARQIDKRGRSLEWVRFVRAWQDSDTVAEVAQKMGFSRAAAHARAATARKNGVPLKTMHRRPPVDWDMVRKAADGADPESPGPERPGE